MNAVRTLVLALALAAVAPAVLTDEALAADVFGPNGSIRLVPMAPIVADGTVVDVLVVAQNPDGTPMTGMILKAMASAGTAGTWAEVGGGVYKIPFHATGLTSATDVTITAKGKSPTTKQTVNLVEKIRVVPPRHEVDAKATPAEITLGRDPEASMTIAGIGKAGLLSALSVGTLENVIAMPGGAYASRFVAPKVNFPQNAIVTLADAADPFAHRGYVVMKLNGSVDFPVKGDPGATVLLEIGDRKFGPTVLAPDGRGKVTIQVAPGVQRATQVTVVGDQERREDLDLRIPETRRLQLFPFPKTLPADASAAIPVRVAVVKPDGSPDPDAKPKFTATVGTVGEPKHLGDGVFEAEWRLPSAPGAARVEVTLGSDLQKDGVDLTLVQGRPATARLEARPAVIEATTTVVEISSLVKDGTGAPFTGATLGYALENGDVDGPVLGSADGAYEFPVKPTGTKPLHVQTWVKTTASQNPVRGVVIVPERASVANDPSAPVDMLVAAVDVFGLPVANAKVALTVTSGGGSIATADVTTGEDGTARVAYTPGRDAALAAIEGAAGGYIGTVAFLQVPAGSPSVAFPATGGEREVAWTKAWTATTASAELKRSAGAPVAVAPIPVAPVAAAGAVAVIDLTTIPQTVKAGGAAKVIVTALDADGNASKASAPTLTATGGTLSPPMVGEDGRVTTTLTVPADATGPVKITATSGAMVEVFTVPVEAGAPVAAVTDASPWDTGTPEPAPVVPEPAPAPAPDAVADVGVVPEPAPIPKPKPPPGDFKWLRARGSGVGSTYRYEQAPSADPGPLIPSRLAVGGPDGGSPAVPVGGEIDVRAWGDAIDVPYVGVHGLFRASQYAIAAEAFEGNAVDALLNAELDLLGRYPFDVAGDRYWVGAKLGFHYNDFLIFTGCLDPGCEVNFDPVPVPGLGLGGELGAEVGPVYLVGGYTLGLARGSDPYSNQVDVNVGYQLHPNVFADLGFGVFTRSVILEGTESELERGTLSDSQMLGKLGVGFSL